MTCPVCDDFRFVPVGQAPGWYQRDWRLLLDPTVRWESCSRCGAERPVWRLQEQLSRLLARRIDEQVDGWRSFGVWQRGLGADGQTIWRHGAVYCLPPGLLADLDAWTLVSELGVMRHLDAVAIAQQLERAGLPSLPPMAGG